MEDLLERMLAVDAQGEALVKDAEKKAIQIREESSAELAKMHEEVSEALAKECQALEEAAVGAALKQKDEALQQAQKRLGPKSAAFSSELDGYRYKLLKELLAI